MIPVSYSPNWELSRLFHEKMPPARVLEFIQKQLDALELQLNAFNPLRAPIEPGDFIGMVDNFSKLHLAFSQLLSYTTCLLAETPDSGTANSLRKDVLAEQTRFAAILRRFQQALSQIPETPWTLLLENETLKELSFILREWRQIGADYNKSERANAHATAYHTLGQTYRRQLDAIRVGFGDAELSIGQATNLRSDSNGAIRKKAHDAIVIACSQEEEAMAKLLNGMAAYRLGIGDGPDASPLDASLRDNRIGAESLDAMWSVVEAHKQPFADYLSVKAQLLGKQRLASSDFWAPVNEENLQMDYQEAAAFLIEHFGAFGHKMQGFAKRAFSEGWIEAEDRLEKSAVAFCAGFPEAQESRIFLTYDGSFTKLLTMAHELGHAFQNHALKDEKGMFRRYPLTLAETASTFSELIVLDSALQKATSKAEQLFLLDEKIKRSTMNFMNLHGRFLFEERLYEERKNGEVPASRLNELMHVAFAEAYGNAMDELPAHSWIVTPHFYIAGSPFYNFPYTFGYLFAVSLYAKAREDTGFEAQYMALLRDSGKMPVEELVDKHLGEDIRSTEFWEKGMRICISDVEAFIALATSPKSLEEKTV